MHIRILGEFEIVSDDGAPIPLPAAQRRLLCTLVLAGEAVPSSRLKSILWGDDTRDLTSAFTSLVHKTRRALPPGRLPAEGGGYRFRLDDEDTVDAREFEKLVERAEKARGNAPEEAADLLQRAVDLWGDPGLPDLPESPSTAAQARRLRSAAQEARAALAEIRLSLGHHRRILPDLRRWMANDPSHERMRRLLMLALYRDGRKGEALSVYAGATDPGVELKRARDEILSDDPGLLTSRPELPKLISIDVNLPDPPRILNFLRGGKDNFEIDRQTAHILITHLPGLTELAAECRKFWTRAAQAAARAGIDQFLEIGSGLPEDDNLHQIVRRLNPEARVVYVDADPMVEIHARALLLDDPSRTAFLRADPGDATSVLNAAETRRLIDFDRPVAVLTALVRHLPGDAGPVISDYMDATAPGSYLLLTAPVNDGLPIETRDLIAQVAPNFSGRPHEELARITAPLELAPPGITDVQHWRNDPNTPLTTQRVLALAARKPGTPNPHL
ncbi:SAM-dependent methyltransferase [Spirillospora sp. CA-294931]|uniref:SAM-dependent methyltransferase n=1 Tax=Spirillospora sp. CA-294931 TaxID=3240042 RepID=UPI003D8E08E1